MAPIIGKWTLFAFLFLSALPARADVCAENDALKAEDFCEHFELSPHLRRDKIIETSRTACVAFYQEAINSRKEICNYVKESDVLAKKANDFVSRPGIGSDDVAQRTISGINSEAAALHTKYLAIFQGAYGKAAERMHDYIRTNGKLGSLAHATLSYEVRCDRTRSGQDPSPAPSGWVEAVRIRSHEGGAQETLRNIQGALREAGMMAKKAAAQSNSIAALAGTRQLNAGSISTSEKPVQPVVDTPYSEAGNANDVVEAGINRGLAQRVGGQIARPLAGNLISQVAGYEIAKELFAKYPLVHTYSTKLLSSGIGASLALTLRAYKKGGVEKLDRKDFISVGAGSVATILLGVGPGLAIGVLASVAEQSTRNTEWLYYQFNQFYGPYLEKNPQASSRDVTIAFQRHVESIAPGTLAVKGCGTF